MSQKRKGPTSNGEAGVQLGGEPGSYKSNSAALQREPGVTLSAVAIFAPWAAPDEKALRLRIHKARDIAVALANREENGEARGIFYHAGQIAHSWVFRRVNDCEQLERVLWGLNQLFLAADHFRQAEATYDS